jgi:hypothetical protein
MAQRSGKQAKKVSLKGIRQDSILEYLDKMINGYYQKNNLWPGKIIINQTIRDKIFAELELEPDLSNSWYDKKDNYKNIPIKIGKEERITLL